MEQSITFNKKDSSRTIHLNAENPFFQITRLEIPSIPKGSRDIYAQAPDFSIIWKVTNEDRGHRRNSIEGIHQYINAMQTEAIFNINTTVSGYGDTQIEFEFKNETENDRDIVIYYTQIEQRVSIKNSTASFKNFLSIHDNVKILFSAPFGQGKTTFINAFFDTHMAEYNVFKLYPVNYAISHNEDIFKYIKAEILFQLLGTNVEFNKEKFSYLKTAPEFFKKNAHKILAPFLLLLPKIGKSALDIYKELHKLASEYLDYHDGKQINDEDKAIEFINALYEKEGSIYEDNFYTQLIRQLLEQLKQSSNKKNVLVIDDIDRMDPDHIFRIFNVFSAHFDSSEYLKGYSNKFGFDKIVLICDYSNIKKIFRHRYGSNVSFDGYFSKYFSHKPFEFNLAKAVEEITEHVTIYKNRKISSFLGDALILIINDLIETNQLSLRELLKLFKNNIYDTINHLGTYHLNEDAGSVPKNMIFYYNIIAFLETITDTTTIIEWFRGCKTLSKTRSGINYSAFTFPALIPLGEVMSIEDNKEITYQCNINQQTYLFEFESARIPQIGYSYLSTKNVNHIASGRNFTFKVSDFYDALILNTESYAKL